MRRWTLLSFVVLAGPVSAAPPSSPKDFVDAQVESWYVPRAHEFVDAAQGLRTTLEGGCTGASVRPGFVAALLAWDRLSTVAIGPLIERRSQRRIDFMPTRPEAIERAIEHLPDDPLQADAAMERIGSAAKGLPALEWLLFKGADKAGAACRYALAVAGDIALEARTLATEFDARKAARLDAEQAVAAFGEALNQWIGALEQLRVQGIERPLGDARARGHRKPQFVRDASGASLEERKVRWQTLRAQAVPDGAAAASTSRPLLPLETYLRGKALGPLADRLVAAVRRVDTTLSDPSRLEAASRSLAALKALAEGDIAPALDVRIGFSDADGD